MMLLYFRKSNHSKFLVSFGKTAVKLKLKSFRNLLMIMAVASCARNDRDRFTLVQGHPQHILELGSGAPAVLFLNGRGSKLEDFTIVQTEITKLTRTLAYDRAGIGKSEAIDTVRTFDIMTRELDAILANENFVPPYILVGHSLGGFLARYFYHIHPEQVAGIVFIDPGHENDVATFLSLRPENVRRRIDSLDHVIDPTWPAGFRHEYEYSDQHDESMRALTPPSGIPVTLFISTKVEGGEDEDPDMARRQVNARTKLMVDWIATIPGAKTILTEKSGHFIHQDEPKLVIDAITEMIQDVRKSMP
jgi:pimeloyl-ACP methyl ester carboxylesterase